MTNVVIWKPEDLATMLAFYPNLANITQWPAMLEVLMEAQKKLPKARRRSRHSILLSLQKNMPRFKELVKRGVQTLAAQEQGEPELPAANPDTKARLADVHWRALAHHPTVKPLLDTKVKFDAVVLADALYMAQKDTLPIEKRRSRERWGHAMYTRGARDESGTCTPLRKLRDAMRYPPLGESLIAPPPKAEPGPTTPLATVMEMVKTTPPEQLVQAGVLVPRLAALKVDMDNLMVKALTVLGEVMLDAFKPTMEETMKAAVKAQGEQMMEGMKRAIEELLGGPSAAPAPAPVEVPPAEAKTDPKTNRLAIDVVGLIGSQADVVVQAFRDATHVDLRFVDSSHGASVDFRSHVILVKKFISHSAEARVRKQAKRFIRVSGAAHSVITAVEALVGEQQAVVH